MSASNAETNLASLIMRWWWGGDHLNSAIHQRGQKNFTHTVGEITKNLQNLKNFQKPPPLLVKNDTSLIPTKNIFFNDAESLSMWI